jgi:transcriptional regulator with XRE-family HTH domain
MTANGCGTHARWQAGCPACQRLSRLYERKRRTAQREGTWKPLVPQAPVLAHLEKLLTAGANITGIAEVSGLSPRTLYGIRHRQWVQGETAAALLAVEKAYAAPPTGFRPAVGACRRIRALVALGWSITEQSRQLGVVMQHVWQLANGKPATVTAATDKAVRALFEQLSSTRGPSVRARNDATRKGWMPPLAWDDIDDPDAEPSPAGEPGVDDIDEVAVERALTGERIDLTDAELVAVVQAGVARGTSLNQIAKQLGLSYFTASKLLGGKRRPRKAVQERVEAEVRRAGHLHTDAALGALLGVHHQTVARARDRLARRGALSAAS